MKKQNRKHRMLPTVFLFGSVLMQTSPLLVNASATGAAAVNQAFGNLISLVTAMISSIGMLLLMWGLLEWGISMASPNGSEQMQALKRVAGGIVIILAPAIANGLV